MVGTPSFCSETRKRRHWAFGQTGCEGLDGVGQHPEQIRQHGRARDRGGVRAGRLIFALPPAEVAVHPAAGQPVGDARHELYLMCDDIEQTRAGLTAKGVTVSDPRDQGWGTVASVTLPGGSELALYQPRHATAHGL
jgi:hypothetical protein